MLIYGKSDIGKVRKSNQDTFAFSLFDENCCFAAVCDGMGGHFGGDIASGIAKKVLEETFENEYSVGNIRERDIPTMLSRIIRYTNEKIFSRALANEELNGMGSTIVLAFVLDSSLYIAHVGDSRAYSCSEDKIIQLTKDHSVVQEMIDSGKITEEEALKHPYKHVITRVMGVESNVKIDINEFKTEKGEKILLCSDGLTNMISDSEILETVHMSKPDEICSNLVMFANERGGADNVTAVVLEL